MEDLTHDGGVLKRILTPALPGAAQPDALNCVAELSYEGRLEDGTVFDSTLEDNSTFRFEVGAGKVIRAWCGAFSRAPQPQLTNSGQGHCCGHHGGWRESRAHLQSRLRLWGRRERA